MAEPVYTGLYINLDRSTDRRQSIEEQLHRFNPAGRYARFAALEPKDIGSSGAIQPGEAACFHSHYRALMQGASSGLPVHILEDDVLLSEYLGAAAQTIVGSDFFGQFDVIFTDTFVHTEVMQLGFYKEAFDHALAGGKDAMKFTVIDLGQRQLACMSSYFVAPRAIEKLLAIFGDELARGPRMPVDFCLRLAAQDNRIRVGCWFPFVTSIMLEYVTASTIAGRESQHNNPSVMLPALLRYAYFVDGDLKGYGQRFLKAMIGSDFFPPDARREFIAKLLEFIVSGRYRNF